MRTRSFLTLILMLTVIMTLLIALPAAAQDSGCSQPLTLSPGDPIVLRGGINVRSQPSINGAIVAYASTSLLLEIAGGPVCADGYNWWQLDGLRNPGWAAEGRPGRYFIIPIDTDEAECPAPTGLVYGTRARLLTGLRVRSDPTFEGRVLTVAPFESLVTVLGGPVCAEGFNWWQIEATVVRVVYRGWVTEGFENDFWLEPEHAAPVCAPPLNFGPGTRGFVRYNDGQRKNLRTAPTISATSIVTLLDGVAFEVVGGPVCADGFNWWQIHILTTNVTGWLAEGGPGNYWMGRITAEELR